MKRNYVCVLNFENIFLGSIAKIGFYSKEV